MLVEELGMGMRILKELDIHGDGKSASLNRSDVTTKAPRYNSAVILLSLLIKTHVFFYVKVWS
jgi:hypothetical protein